MKRHLSVTFLIVLVICALLYGCSSGTTNTTSPTQAPATNTSAETATPAATATVEATPSNFNETGYPIVQNKVNLTCMISQVPQHGDFNSMMYFKTMEQVTNVHMDFQVVPSSDWDTKLNLALASGDFPNWIYSPVSPDNLQKYGSEGKVFVNIAPYLDQYMPNLVKMFATYPLAKSVITMQDGSIFCMPYIADDATCAGDCVYIRMDLLKKTSVLTKPSTIDDFYNLLMAFKDAKISDDFIPLLPEPGLDSIEGFLFPSFGPGWDPGFADNGDGKVVYNYISDQFNHYLQFVNKLYTEKLLDNNTFTTDYATVIAETKANKAGVIRCGTSLTLDNFSSGKFEVELFPPLTSQYTQDRKIRGYNSVSMNGGTITNKCSDEDVKTLLRWMDINYSEAEVAPGLNRLSQWLGIKGVSYDLKTDNGTDYWSILEPADQTLSGYEWSLKYACPGGWICASVTRAIPAGDPAQEMKATQSLESLYPYMKPTFPDQFLKYSSADQEALANSLTDILTYVNQMKAKFITGTESLDDANWNNFVSHVKSMGIDNVLAIKQKAYDSMQNK